VDSKNPKVDADISAIVKSLQKVIKIIPKNIIDGPNANELYDSLKSNKRYEHEFVLGINEVIEPSLWLIAEADYAYLPDAVTPLLWFWNNRLFPMFTITLYWNVGKTKKTSLRAFFPYDSYEWNLFLKNKAKVIVLRKGRCIAALELDMPKIDPRVWPLMDPDPPRESVRDLNAAKTWVEGKIPRMDRKDDRLEFTWADRLEVEVGSAIGFLNDPAHAVQIATEKEIVLHSPFSQSLACEHGIAAHIYLAYVNTFLREKEDRENLGAHVIAIRKNLAEAPLFCTFVENILSCAWFSSMGTSCGHEVLSITIGGTAEAVPLSTEVLGNCVNHFWDRFPFSLPLYYKELCGESACPIDMYEFVKGAPLYQGDLEKGEQFINNVLAEATSLKQWTIPFGAYVQVELGIIKAVKMFELNNEVACVLVDHSGHYLVVWAEPSTQSMAVSGEATLARAVGRMEHIKTGVKTDFQLENWERITMGIKVLLACIIRDFWIVEERERVFGASYLTKKTPRLRSEWGKKVIVYIPRIHYVGDIKNNADTLDLATRKAHFVVGHLRKALHASEDQIILARKYGIVVPEGFTFVRPHRRGDQAQDHIYRSRSALNCIRALTNLPEGNTKDAWFTFELNVKQWLSSNGYEVVHLAGSRNGDGGVDIQALRKDENLLVQCKYRTREKIGPSVIRELLGTLKTFPAGASGVIVTSSELTDGAKQLAVEHNVQFIERADFLAGLGGKI